jgi:hypothetical protein
LAVAQAQQEFARESVRAADFIGHLGDIEGKRFACAHGLMDPALQGGQEIAG